MENPRGSKDSNNNNNGQGSMITSSNSDEENYYISILMNVRIKSKNPAQFANILYTRYKDLLTQKLVFHLHLFNPEELSALIRFLAMKDPQSFVLFLFGAVDFVNRAKDPETYTLLAKHFWTTFSGVDYFSSSFTDLDGFLDFCEKNAQEESLYLVPFHAIVSADDEFIFDIESILNMIFTYNHFTIDPIKGSFWLGHDTELVPIFTVMINNWLSVNESIEPMIFYLRKRAVTNKAFVRFFLLLLISLLSSAEPDLHRHLTIPSNNNNDYANDSDGYDDNYEVNMNDPQPDFVEGDNFVTHTLSLSDLKALTDLVYQVDDGNSSPLLEALDKLVLIHYRLLLKNTNYNHDHPMVKEFDNFLDEYGFE